MESHNWFPAARAGDRRTRVTRGDTRTGGDTETGEAAPEVRAAGPGDTAGAPGDAAGGDGEAHDGGVRNAHDGDAHDGGVRNAHDGGVRDAARFEELVVAHSAALHGYLARRAPAAADDLLAEVWLRAFAGRAGYDPARGTARVWLFGVARHVLAAHWRGVDGYGPGGRTGAAGTAASAGDAGRAGAGAGAEPSADPWAAVDQRLDAAAVAPLIRRTLSELPHVERELLLLVTWEQLTPAEAAAVVGVPQGTARSRLHRARARLRDVLADTPAFTGTTGGLR
jgi:RNA polymerase sigma-70 factor (ECF subfamily)